MKYLITLLSITLLSINLIAQIEGKQIGEQIAALEDSVQVKIEQYGEKNGEVVDTYFDLFDVLHKNANYDKALIIAEKCYNSCLEIFGEKHPSTAIAYFNLGEVYIDKGNYTKALKCHQKALAIRLDTFGEMDSLSADSYNSIGVLYYYKGDYSYILENIQKALEIRLEIFGEKHPSTATSFNNIGFYYSRKGVYDKALEYCKKALTIRLEILGEEQVSTANTYNNIGLIYSEKGDYNKALENYQNALVIRLEIFGKKHPELAVSFNNLAGVYRDTGNYDKALGYFQKALMCQLKVLGEKHPYNAKIFDNTGLIYARKGDYANALKYHRKAFAIRLEVLGEKHPELAVSFNNLGGVYNETGDYTKALDHYKKALTIRLEILGEMHPLTAHCYNNIAAAYKQKYDYTNALEYHHKALAIRLEILGEIHPSTAASYNNIGAVYKGTYDYVKALEYLQKAITINLEIFGEKHPRIATSFNNMAEVYKEKSEYHKALEYYNKAIAIRLEILSEKHLDLIFTQVSLANVFEALSYFNQADSLWNIIIPNMEDQLAKNYLFLPDSKKIMYLKTTENIFTSFYNYITHNGSDRSKLMATKLIINSKSQILDYAISTRRLIQNINNGNLDSLAFQLNIFNQKIAKAELLTKNELKQKGWSLDTLYLEQDELASQILAHPQLKAKLNPPKFSWRQIQGKLQDDEALIDYFTFYDRVDSVQVYHAMLIKKDEPKPIFIPLSISKSVIELLLTKGDLPLYIQYTEARQEMYGYLWQALKPHLNDIKTIHLTPVASLNRIDFESLQNEQRQYLADLYDFHYYSSSKDFYKQKSDKPYYTNANLYGHIAYYKDDEQQYEAEEDTFALRLQRDKLGPLPATLKEVKAIEKICNKNYISSTLLTINAAKEDTIIHFSENRAPSILHFATHGAYLQPLHKKEDELAMESLTGQDRFRAADNPLQRSMLMLSNAGETWQKSGPNIIADNDGILTALEVTNLDLSNTELVVLSACNSGIGSQHTTEGVFGLPRAFKLAGVNKILVSLWPVEDETTKELMIQFYTNLLQNKQDAATALRNAKAEMRKRNDAPKKWAGFVLVE